jgi:hypothetical protein
MNTTHTFGSTKQRAHSFDVSICKFGFVDKIAHADSIRSRMIIAEYVGAGCASCARKMCTESNRQLHVAYVEWWRFPP